MRSTSPVLMTQLLCFEMHSVQADSISKFNNKSSHAHPDDCQRLTTAPAPRKLVVMDSPSERRVVPDRVSCSWAKVLPLKDMAPVAQCLVLEMTAQSHGHSGGGVAYD
jgi:hypothetical protein